jgi:hypothetical protein
MPPIHKLSKGGAKLIHDAIDEIFDKLKIRFLGPHTVKTGKKLYVGFRRDVSLPGIFERAASEEGVVRPDLDLLDSLSRVASNYIDGTRERAKAKVSHEIDGWLREQTTKKVAPDALNEALKERLGDVWKEITTAAKTIIETESTKTRNVSIMDGIVKMNAARGIEDPVVYFIVVRDDRRCGECTRLHLMEDEVTPRCWHLSSVGHGYHTKGDDFPKLGGLHPNCRCTMVTLLPGFGFDKKGGLTFIGPDHLELEKQRDAAEEEMEKAELEHPHIAGLKRITDAVTAEDPQVATDCEGLSNKVARRAQAEGIPAVAEEGDADLGSTHPNERVFPDRDWHVWVRVGSQVFDAKEHALRHQRPYRPIYRNHKPYVRKSSQDLDSTLQQVLPESDDLRRKPYQGDPNVHVGHCYVASEALFHLLGGRAAGWVPQFIRHEGQPHWFLRHGHTGEIADPTAKQFKTPVPYEQGVGKGFLTKVPSKRAQALIDRMTNVKKSEPGAGGGTLAGKLT